ncbi:MAG: 50S ribosomal protein L25 [Ignavibacteriales bacterium]|nr:50S ribosomal protein L25 [Ignavibacteriales bacterium]
MAEVVLQVEVRQQVGKQAKRVRQAGKIPGIYYCSGEENINVTATVIGLKPLIYTSQARLVNLKLDNGQSKTCVLRTVQFDPVTDAPVHFDLQGVKEDELLTIDVPVLLVGAPKGVKDGGMMQHIMHRLRVSCLPKHIPDHIEINVAELEINDSVHIKDIAVENVHLLDNPANTIVAVVPPTVLKEEVPADAAVVAAATAAEPEVIGKGKKPEEGEEAAGTKKEAPGAKKEEKK